ESGGVWDARHKRLPEVRANDIEGLIEKKVVRDGMIPKLRSCAQVLKGGVGEIDIISSSAPAGLLQVLESRGDAGTRILR
ncbi:MAG: acetylglutamate kinase, partial [Terriglobia bacterium]